MTWKRLISPATQLSIGLALFAGTVILLAETVGLIPDPMSAIVKGRVQLTEAIAWHCVAAVKENKVSSLGDWATKLAERNQELLSVALRRQDGQLGFATSEHVRAWGDKPQDASTPTHMTLPVFNGDKQWGHLEVSFAPPSIPWMFRSGMALGACLAGVVFIVSRIYLGRILKRLDPSAVIPARVRAMLDTMSEGVLILDNHEQIVMANAAFLTAVGDGLQTLLGRSVSKLQWRRPTQEDQQEDYPWTLARRTGQKQTGKALEISGVDGSKKLFMVNASPIMGHTGQQRGLLATFDDVTGLEEKNIKLRTALDDLQASRREIADKNTILSQQKQELEHEVEQRKQAQREGEALHRELENASHRAGMAEVATSVLHNVGNVLNSAGVSIDVMKDRLRATRLPSLTRAVNLLTNKAPELATFLTTDPKGKLLPEFLTNLSGHLLDENDAMQEEVKALSENVEHIKEIVRSQQTLAAIGDVDVSTDLAESLENALNLVRLEIESNGISVNRELQDVPPIVIKRHKVLQILVNLVRNAVDSLSEIGVARRILTVRLRRGRNNSVSITVQDTGTGISADAMPKLFTYGFTTKKHGHGFGLHAASVAAKELGATLEVFSEGPGHGAMFVLELPTVPGERICTYDAKQSESPNTGY